MNKEELIGKLQMVYVGDKNALNELIGYYDGLKEVVETEQQCKKQKEVINKAVEYINQHWVIDNPVGFKNDLLEILEKEVSE